MGSEEAKGKAAEVTGEAKGTLPLYPLRSHGVCPFIWLSVLTGDCATGKANEVAGKAKGKAEEVKGKL